MGVNDKCLVFFESRFGDVFYCYSIFRLILVLGSQPPLGGVIFINIKFFPFADDGAPKRAEYAVCRSRIPTFDIFILIILFSFIIRRLQPTKKPNQTKGLRAWRKINNIKYGLKIFNLQNVLSFCLTMLN